MICYSRVKFLGKNGTKNELFEAKNIFNEGQELIVFQININDFSTKLWFRNYAGKL